MSHEHARDIMTKKLITIGLHEGLLVAYQMMRECGIRHLPVVDSVGDVVGIISDRDLQRAMTPQIDPQRVVEEESVEFNPKYQVKDFMTWPVRAISEEVLVEEVAERMLREKVSAMLVMSSTQRPRGIVTTDDLLKLLVHLLKKEPGGAKMSLGSLLSSTYFSSGQWAS